MNYLLDTHTLLWTFAAPDRLGAAAMRVITSADAGLNYSVASLWEIAIKRSLGKLDLAGDWLAQIEKRCAQMAIRLLLITPAHCLEVSLLPWVHKDPFDRLLIAQGRVEGLTVLSKDDSFDGYGIARLWL